MENLGQFERYRDGNMTESEKADFLKRISEDTSFEQEFKIYNEVNDFVLNNEKRSEFVSVLKEVESDYFSTKKKHFIKNINYKYVLKIAASVAIIVISTISLYYIFYSKPSDKELFAQYYQPLKMDEVTRSVSDSTTKIQEGFIAYQMGNYQKSLQILSTELSANELSTPVILIKGLSYLEFGKYNDAETLLKKASEDIHNAYYDDCLWYLSLIYIRTDRAKQSIPLLKKLIERKSVYNNMASELLKNIKHISK